VNHFTSHEVIVSAAVRRLPRLPGVELTVAGVWFGDPVRPAAGWLTRPAGRLSASAVLVLPPVGYGYLCSHRTLRVLAERLAAAGHLVLRIDYDGTGDSAGDQWEPQRVPAWRRSVSEAVAYLRGLGAEHLTVVGIGLGATFALLDREALGAERVVAWYPVLSGRRHVKEIRLLSTEVPAAEDPFGGTQVWAGNVFTAETLTDISRLSVEAPADVLVVNDPGERVVDVPPEFAVVPEGAVEQICGWVGGAPSSPAAAEPEAASATFAWRDGEVSEEVVRLADLGHVAVRTTAGALAPDRATLVFLNPGSETHVGPGRAWVEYARSLALLGHPCVRVDFRGWGESPDAGHAPGRPYDHWCVEDTTEIVRGLRAAGHQRLVLFGLCASAWIALRAVLETPVEGVIALNPQLYWKPGDPVDIDWERIRARRAQEIWRVAQGHRLGLWTALDLLGQRPRVARWLNELDGAGPPIELLFAEGDDGLVYLRQRAGRRLGRLHRVRVTELPGVDHPMHRAWRRTRVVEALHEALNRIDRA
jgi:pimeloyl-ACP methyl ester carboxylesterase